MNVTDLHREFRHYALVERGLSPNTVRDVLAILCRLCTHTGTSDTAALTTPVIKSFLYHGRLDLGWSERTFRLYRQYLKTFFEWCTTAGYLRSNPVTPIEKPRLPQRLPRCLSHDEAQKILYQSVHAPVATELQRLRREAIVATFLMTGIRRQELLNLRHSDLDFHAGLLSVRSGKGRKDRSIPLHPRLVPVLRRYIAEKNRHSVTSDWLFSSMKSDAQLTSKNLYAILKPIAKAANVKFTPHMLRHTFGRELVESDFNVYKLKEIMGHSSVATTQTYVALSQQSIKQSFEQTKIY